MKLFDLQTLGAMRILRDGEFRSLGLLSHRGDRLLVAFYDSRFTHRLVQNCDVSCVLTSSVLADRVPSTLAVAIVEDPQAVFYRAHRYLLQNTTFYGEDFPTEVSADAAVHPEAWIAPRNVRIGPGCMVEAHAIVLERTIMGAGVVIRAGAVVGGEGFEPKNIDGRKEIIPHAGGVRLHDRVEVQSNSHIAKSVFGSCTEIGEGTKIDALVHIAHNAQIGRDCEIAAGAVVAGSTRIGDRVWIGPGAVVSSEVRIGNDAAISLGAVVIRDVPDGQRVSGNFAIDHGVFLRLAHAWQTGKTLPAARSDSA